jgi:hypothetical protein
VEYHLNLCHILFLFVRWRFSCHLCIWFIVILRIPNYIIHCTSIIVFLIIHLLHCLILMTSLSIVFNLTTSLFPPSCSWIAKSNPSGSSTDKSWHAFLPTKGDTESHGEGAVHLGNTSSCFFLRAGHEWFTHTSTARGHAPTCTRCAQMRCCYSRSTGELTTMISYHFLR